MPDFFAYYGLQPAFFVDEAALKLAYLKKQKQWHPDFHAADPAMAEQALSETATNNLAFKTLQTLENRVLYVLVQYGLWKEGEKHSLPQDFLMEMLDLNDLIESALTGNEADRKLAEKQLLGLETDTYAALEQFCRKADVAAKDWSAPFLQPLRQEFEKLRYIRRLRSNLTGRQEF